MFEGSLAEYCYFLVISPFSNITQKKLFSPGMIDFETELQLFSVRLNSIFE